METSQMSNGRSRRSRKKTATLQSNTERSFGRKIPMWERVTEYRVKSIFVEGLHDRIKSNVQTYWSTPTNEDFHTLDSYDASSETFGENTIKASNPPNEINRSNRGHGRGSGAGSVDKFADSMSTSDATFPAEVDLTKNEEIMLLNDDTASLATSAETNTTSPTTTGTKDVDSIHYCRVCLSFQHAA